MSEAYNGQIVEDLDPFLGPYPYASLKTWFSLSSELRPTLLAQLVPASGRITAQCALTTLEDTALKGQTSRVDREHPERFPSQSPASLPFSTSLSPQAPLPG